METNEAIFYDAVIVGGGLAGLSAAAYLAKKGKKVVVLERGNLGGRAVTLKIKGFSFNFGAHAIYGRDSSVLHKFEKELGINIDWRDFEPRKAKYDIGDKLTDMPANIQGLFNTSILNSLGKIKFTFEIFKTMLHMEKGHPHLSIEKWMEEKEISSDVRDMMLTLASSNFFTREPGRIPSDVFFNYYQRLFTTNKPVAYIGGGWQALINEFVRVIEENGGTIVTKAKAEAVEAENSRVTAVQTTQGVFKGQEFLFCIPPKELEKIVGGTKIEYFIKQYSSYEPSYVYVYDIGLEKRIEVPYTYIYDKQNKMFITDISHYDETCVPEGGQLLQAIAYLTEEDLKDKEKIQEYHEKIEALYDKHFAGWRDRLVVPRVSKRAAAQEIKWTMNQDPMPLYLPDYRNVFFAGDWCEGKGQLSELSFHSAYEASKLILQKYSYARS
jgi:15-cis-phytoene desaturase